MTPLAILPAWFPTEAAFIGVVVGLVYLVLTNREDRWAIELLNPRKAALVGLGVVLVLNPDVLGLVPAVPDWVWPAAGIGLVAIGLLAEHHVIELELDWLAREADD